MDKEQILSKYVVKLYDQFNQQFEAIIYPDALKAMEENAEGLFTKEQMIEIAWEAWKLAANAYKIYPENKHTFSDVKTYLVEQHLTPKTT
jgi:hypothetical protein